MKILIYVSSLSNGGAERVASLWANGFVNENHDVCIMLNSFALSHKYKISEKIRVVGRSLLFNFFLNNLPTLIKKSSFITIFLNNFFRILPSIIKKRCIANILKKESPDLIIVVMQSFFKPVNEALQLLKKNIPIIVTDHYCYERPAYAPFTEKQYKEKFKDVIQYDYMTVLTEADKKVLEEKFDSDFMKKVFVLPNPLTFRPLETVPAKDKVILAAGRLDGWFVKGFDILLKAWSMVQMDFPEWKLKIAGGGDNSLLMKICNELGIASRVEFLGFVDVEFEYKNAEVFILSSRYEGFGMVLTEAMSQGCACIACDYKGRQREIIANSTQGVLCPPDNERAIAEALRKVILDESYRRNLQENAIERSKYYVMPNIMKRWNEIFEKMRVINAGV